MSNPKNSQNLYIAIFLRFLGGGGIERVLMNLAHSFTEQGIKVDLVLSQAGGPHMSRIPSAVTVVDFAAPRLSACLPDLVRYLQRQQPTVLLCAGHYTNELALWAKRLSGVSTRIVVSEHNQLSLSAKSMGQIRRRLIPWFIRLFYPWADGIIAVSHGVADDLAKTTGLDRKLIQVIYNPAILPGLLEKAKEPLTHPWFAPGEPPVILGVGRLEAQKDFPTLIRAFSQVRQIRPARLMILGWGPDQPKLEALVKDLGLEEDVSLFGYVDNPYPYMAKASVFALSSAWEGLPTVLIEAMALGTPVVSTDCPSGAAEILNNGKYGLLTPVGDGNALAEAIVDVLDGKQKKVDPVWIEQFGLEAATKEYCKALELIPS